MHDSWGRATKAFQIMLLQYLNVLGCCYTRFNIMFLLGIVGISLLLIRMGSQSFWCTGQVVFFKSNEVQRRYQMEVQRKFVKLIQFEKTSGFQCFLIDYPISLLKETHLLIMHEPFLKNSFQTLLQIKIWEPKKMGVIGNNQVEALILFNGIVFSQTCA